VSAAPTHAELVTRVARWLHNTKGHTVVLIECGSAFDERPDVIAWKGGWSTLVEVKVSRADFLADRAKPFRANPELGLGRRRWYCAPPGVVAPADLPPRWGLVEPRGRSMRVVVEADRVAFEMSFAAQRNEGILLASAVQRVVEGWGRGAIAYPLMPASGPPPAVCVPCARAGGLERAARLALARDYCSACSRPIKGQVGADENRQEGAFTTTS
jgi:hypothetical protein